MVHLYGTTVFKHFKNKLIEQEQKFEIVFYGLHYVFFNAIVTIIKKKYAFGSSDTFY